MSYEFGSSQPESYPLDNQKQTDRRRLILIIAGVAVACLGILACITLFTGGIVATVFGAIRASEPYQVALELAQTDSDVLTALGEPVEPGIFVLGSIETSGQSGFADLQIPLKGSEQNGTLHVSARRVNGEWQYDTLSVTYGDDQQIIIDDVP